MRVYIDIDDGIVAETAREVAEDSGLPVKGLLEDAKKAVRDALRADFEEQLKTSDKIYNAIWDNLT